MHVAAEPLVVTVRQRRQGRFGRTRLRTLSPGGQVVAYRYYSGRSLHAFPHLHRLTHFLPAGPIITSAQHTAAMPGTSRPPPQTVTAASPPIPSVCVQLVCFGRNNPEHSLETIVATFLQPSLIL